MSGLFPAPNAPRCWFAACDRTEISEYRLPDTTTGNYCAEHGPIVVARNQRRLDLRAQRDTVSECAIHGVRGIMCDDACRVHTRDLRRSHVCEEHAVDHGDEPQPNGEITLTKRCGVCGRKLGGIIVDRVLYGNENL